MAVAYPESFSLVWTGQRPPTHNAEVRAHRMHQHSTTREWRNAFQWIAAVQRVPRLERFEVYATPLVRNRRSMPDTGACAPAVKAAIDGIVAWMDRVTEPRAKLDDGPERVIRICYEAPRLTMVDGLEILLVSRPRLDEPGSDRTATPPRSRSRRTPTPRPRAGRS